MQNERVLHLQKKAQQDVLYITSPENLLYYSGFSGGEGALVIRGDEKKLFTDSRYTEQAKSEAPAFEVLDVAKTTSLSYLKEVSPKAVGYEAEFVSAKRAKELEEALESAEWIDIGKEMLEQRAIKDGDEREKTEEAARIADEAFKGVLPLIRPGVTEREIAAELTYRMQKMGADKPSFDMICASGVRSSLPHGTASDKKIETGDFVTLDFGCFYKGYASDMTRTVVLGRASEKQKEIYNVVLSAQLAAIDSIAPGKSGYEIDKIARDIIKEAGYGDCFGHGLGHGTGLLIHEQPRLSPKSNDILKPGMLVTVEPGIYIENFGGVRIEDLILVTETGFKNLTHATKELLVL